MYACHRFLAHSVKAKARSLGSQTISSVPRPSPAQGWVVPCSNKKNIPTVSCIKDPGPAGPSMRSHNSPCLPTVVRKIDEVAWRFPLGLMKKFLFFFETTPFPQLSMPSIGDGAAAFDFAFFLSSLRLFAQQ